MQKRIGIMQPYFLPYLGYWQLINYVDEFILYDTIQYTKKGWITRNRYLKNGKDDYFSLAIRQDSSTLDVNERYLSPDYDRQKLIRMLEGAYSKAPHFKSQFSIFEDIILNPEMNLFSYIENSIHKICSTLDIQTKITSSSTLTACPRDLKGQDRVINIVRALSGTDYINPIGGVELYDKAVFLDHNINLGFLKMADIQYPQFNHDFVPCLSIMDVMMFNSVETVQDYLKKWEEV